MLRSGNSLTKALACLQSRYEGPDQALAAMLEKDVLDGSPGVTYASCAATVLPSLHGAAACIELVDALCAEYICQPDGGQERLWE